MEHTGRSVLTFRRWSRSGGAPCRILGDVFRSLSLRFFPPMRSLILFVAVVLLSGSAAAQTVRYVDADATGMGDGSSWADAFPYLQQALAVADAGDEVWVAEGTYRPTDGSLDPDDRTVSFALTDGVGLYGGFDGTEAEREERDWATHASVLSGDIGAPNDSTDNSYHVVVASGVSAATTLDGFVVRRGRADAASTPHNEGGGLRAVDAGLLVRHVRFIRNGGGLGGGAYLEGGEVLLEGVKFEENVGGGGGVYAKGGTPVLRQAVFRANFASGLFLQDVAGALVEDALFVENERSGLDSRSSSFTVRRSTFRNNTCTPGCSGGAVHSNGGTFLFEDCLFEGNTAVAGGAVEAAGATPAFVRTTFRENAGTGDVGGAIQLDGNDPDVASPALFLGCRFERNRGPGGGGLFAFGTALAVVNTVFVGNRAYADGTGGGAVFVNTAPATAPGGGPGVAFANVVVAGNEGRDGGGLLLANLPGAARLVNTTVAGNRSLGVGGGVSTFEAGGLSFENSVIWGNEVPGGAEGGVALFHEAGEGPTVERSIVEGGCPVAVDCEGVLDADPVFARSPHPGGDGQWGTADDDYGDLRLVEGSPGVDAGLASLLPADRWDLDGDGDTAEPLPLDIADGPRVVGAEVDLGAYEGTVPVAAESSEPTASALTLDAYPNPARGPVAVTLRLDRAQRAEVALLDVRGRRVAVLHDGPLAAGRHAFRLAIAALPSGVYFLRLSGDASSITRRLVVLR